MGPDCPASGRPRGEGAQHPRRQKTNASNLESLCGQRKGPGAQSCRPITTQWADTRADRQPSRAILDHRWTWGHGHLVLSVHSALCFYWGRGLPHRMSVIYVLLAWGGTEGVGGVPVCDV
jgi:hypothetical protein